MIHLTLTSTTPDSLRTPYELQPYTRRMDTALLVFMRVIEWLFFIGLAGSAIVVSISFFEDIGVLFERDKPSN